MKIMRIDSDLIHPGWRYLIEFVWQSIYADLLRYLDISANISRRGLFCAWPDRYQ